ncbi:hypothetical protein BJX64DRAFT_294539 [Aspergillus heterothallicus]
MKPTAIHFVLIAALPGVLAFSDACRKSLVYCGSTLTRYNGYSTAELRSAIPVSPPTVVINPPAYAAYAEPGDGLFRCVDNNGRLDFVDFCTAGCTNPPNGDTCASGDGA